MTTKKPISVVVPTYNEEKTIGSLLEALINQSYPIDEIVISDFNSKDKTIDIVNKYIDDGNNITLAKRRRKCRGAGRNSGILSAKNHIIALIDAGSIPEKNWIENLISLHKDDDDIIFGSVKPYYENILGYCLGVLIVDKSNKDGVVTSSVCSMLLSKNIWEEVGGFKESETGEYIVEDIIFINEIKRSKNNIFYSNKAIVNWKMLNNIKDIFAKFTEYSTGAILASFANRLHYGIIKNLLILIPLLIFSFFNPIILILPLILIFFRSISYLKNNMLFIKMNLFKKIKITLVFTFLIILVDLASINGFRLWLLKYKF